MCVDRGWGGDFRFADSDVLALGCVWTEGGGGVISDLSSRVQHSVLCLALGGGVVMVDFIFQNSKVLAYYNS